jgi:amino acid adenylation domain-containing protein
MDRNPEIPAVLLSRIRPGGTDQFRPLSLVQHRLWHERQQNPSITDHVIAQVQLQGALNRPVLLSALNRIVARHEVLRATFRSTEEGPVVVIGPVDSGFALTQRTVQGERRVVELRRYEEGDPFDLSTGPLIRGQLLQLSSDEHVLLIAQHPIVSDRTSLHVLLRELGILYTAFSHGQSDPLPPLERQYADYARMQSEQMMGTVLEQRLEFKTQAPSDAPHRLQLPTDRPRGGAQDYAAARVPLALSAQLTERLRALASQQGVTVLVPILSSVAVLLARWSGQDDVVIGTPIANRSPQWAPLIGPFTDMAALRFRLSEDLTIEQLLAQAKTVVSDATRHQDVLFEPKVDALKNVRSDGQVFQVLIELSCTSAQSVASARRDLTELKFLEIPLENSRTPLELSLSLNDGDGGLTGTLEYARDLFDQQTINRMVACWRAVLEGMVTDVGCSIHRLPMLPESERHQVIELFNATQVAYPQEKLIHELFEEQVRRTPAAVAVVYEGQSLTYAELNGRANQLARYLREKGVGPDQLVGVCVERSPEMVVGLLGILKSGGAYVALDPNYPSERLKYIVGDAAPKALLIHERLRGRLPETTAQVIAIDHDWKSIAQQPSDNLDARALDLSSHQLAYVIYTSGSTGQPKGVAIEHRNAVNLILWAQYAIYPEIFRQTLLSTSLNFDLSVYECFVPLATGGSVRVVENALALLNEPGEVTLINTVPSAISGILDSGSIPDTTQVVNLAGEVLKQELVERIFARSKVARVCNLYGPSETTTYSTWVSMTRTGGFIASIGHPIANTQIYILDQYRQVVPIGVVGEIYIGGRGVARGYLNRPELTAERFLSDPFSADAQARMYKTGDLGRWRADGKIEYLGRNDHQVKIRGFRIELGEIEAQLVRYAGVKEVAVIVREDVPGEKRLVAYVIANTASAVQGVPTVEMLRTHVKSVLPEHMVPSAFVMLERFPQTPNGKLDRGALPAPALGAYVTRAYEAPRGDVEKILAAIWQELLQVAQVGRKDNFFELGGHSLLIVEMLERLRRVGHSADARRVFASSTLADLATTLTSDGIGQFEVPPNRIPNESELITPQMLPLVELEPEQIEQIVRAVPGGAANIQDIYPLAPLQEGILFHHLLNEQGGDTYVLPILLALSSRDRLEELIAALQAVIDRHDVLRTAVLWEQLPRPIQVVYREATLPVEEIVLDRGRDPVEQLKERMRPDRLRLDLRHAPMMRLETATERKGEQWYAVLQIHHLACDHESLDTMLAEVMAYIDGRQRGLPEPVPYRNHVAQALEHARSNDAEAFFRSKLVEIDEPTAPFGLLDVYGDGSRTEEASETLEPALARRVRSQARRLNLSPAILFHAASALVVSRTSGRDDVVYGSVLSGRLQGSAGAQRSLLGMFINTLPLRVRLQDITVEQLVTQTQQELVELLDHEQASLAVAQRCSGIAGSRPLFSTMLNYLHGTLHAEIEQPASGVQVLSSLEWTNYPIMLAVADRGEEFVLTAQTDRRIDPQRMTGYLHAAMQSLVESLEEAPQTLALSLSILPRKERHQVIELFNATQAAYPQEKLIHEMFEEQVERTPAAVAVMCEGRSLTYAELNGRANQLARHLRDKGVGPDQLVGICVGRGLEMVLGVLGVLKAGGAYVPLDPKYPPERLAYMLKDAAPRVLLTQERLRERVPETAAEIIALDGDWNEIAGKSTSNLNLRALGAHSHHLAYVIYTSGSTGTPKGVMVEHAGLLNYLQWALDEYALETGESVIVSSPLAFDATVTSLYCPLLSGRSVVLVADGQELEGLEQLLQQPTQWSLIKISPAHLQVLGQRLQSAKLPCTVGAFVIGGEALPPTTVELWRSIWPQVRLINEYGPTETVVGCCVYDIPPEWVAERSVPIGRPIANTRIYMLDPHRQPAPLGVVGEIYIGGVGVTRGYLNRPELTAEHFLSDPFSADPQARMYKTGDLGRWRTDGTIEYLGRNDHQVKIRGFRIELGEIEAQLVRHAHIKEAVVLAREDVPGEKRLVAYVVSQDPSEVQKTLSVEALREYLKSVLPEHMVPSAFVMLEKLPLTANGKLDRRVLLAPELGAYVSRQYEAPQGEVEEILAWIWQGLLRVDRVGRQDNFFELGGHSILAMQVIVRLRASFSIDMPISVLFDCQTLKQLSARVDDLRQAVFLDKLTVGGNTVKELLERVASMPDSKVQELVRELRTEGRP